MTAALQAAVDEQSAWQFIGAVTHIIDQLDPADATATDLGNAIGRIQRARERHLPSWAQRDGRGMDS